MWRFHVIENSNFYFIVKIHLSYNWYRKFEINLVTDYFLGTYSFALYSKINYWFCLWSYYANEILNNNVNHFMRNYPNWNINDTEKPWEIFYGLCFWIHLHPMVQSTLQSRWGISQEIKCFVILLANSCKII